MYNLFSTSRAHEYYLVGENEINKPINFDTFLYAQRFDKVSETWQAMDCTTDCHPVLTALLRKAEAIV
jgi:hypothetical protein